MKKISIPFIENNNNTSGLEKFHITKTKGACIEIDRNNWDKEFPYSPEVKAYLSYNKSGITIFYTVSCQGLRTMSPKDGNYVHEDSCVEFFFQKERGSRYINIEFNAFGICYASHHKTPKESIPFSTEEYLKIERYSSVKEKGIDKKGEYSWELACHIPWQLLGYATDFIPEKFYANLYKCGDKTSAPHFLSWSEITNYDNPTFHCPENFGEIELLKH